MALGAVNKQFLCCDGCLSVDRKLKPVENGSILIHILFDEKDFIKINMMVCWECASMLTKILMFRRRVQRAQGVLQRISLNGKNITLSDSLSNLCMKINTDVVDVSHEEKGRDLVENMDDVKENDTDHQNEERESENYFDAEKLGNDSDNDHVKTEYESRTNNELPRSHEKSKRKYERKVEVIKENFTKLEIAKYFRKIIVSEEEGMKVLEKEKKNCVYIKRPFKCEMCVCSFVTEHAYKKHNEHKHSKENGSYTCNLCETYLPSKRHMHEHWKSHLRLYECTLCGYTCLHKNMQRSHLRMSHSKRYKCKMCSSLFRSRKDFSDHYKELHFKLICDHCGKKFSMRRSIENHIKRNHGSRDCMLCHRHYKTYHSLENHYRMRHPFMISKNLKNEDSYCVECDKQFDSVYKYKNHLRTSVRHTPPKKISVPCPDCGKVFSKKTYMKNHHKLAHIKQSEHHCSICDKYFITAFSLRQHKQTVHDKITVPRDKICNVCGRAFKANRNLIYHMRTHTGERPFRCEYCAASFAQKIAMTSHIKTVHLKNKIINQCLSSFLNTNQ